MIDLVEIFSSKEIVAVILVALLASLLCVVIYIVEKNNDKFRKKHNTKELNELVEQINEEYPEEVNEEVVSDEPILIPIEEDTNTSVNVVNSSDVNIVTDNNVVEQVNVDVDLKSIDDKVDAIISGSEKIEEEDDELEYTTIEPDQETARLELKKLTEELIKQEELERQELEKQELEKEVSEPVIVNSVPIVEEKTNNIDLTNFEEEQEKAAIISLEELIRKGRTLYEANEVTQYEDEGNEPISIQDLEKKMDKKVAVYEEPFIISNVVEDKVEENVKVENAPVEVKKFKSSPIISPIFGIEKDNSSDNSLELENTANYEKLDDEIKKTNEFLMTLKELQKKLD